MSNSNNMYVSNGVQQDELSFQSSNGLTIYKTQSNIAEEIVSKFNNNTGFISGKEYKKIRFLVVSPAYLELKSQTTSDFFNFFYERINQNHPAYTSLFIGIDIQMKLNHKLSEIIVNSNNLDTNNKWMEKVKYYFNKKDHDCLHVLIIDELHWGSSKNCKLVVFLEHLYDQVVSKDENFPLLILGVSATIDVLSKVLGEKDNPNRSSQNIVDWGQLEKDDPSRFKSGSYRDINEMNFINDSKLVQSDNRSAELKKIYMDCFNFILNSEGGIDESKLCQITLNTIKPFIPCNEVKPLFQNQSILYTDSNFKKIMVVVKFRKNDDIIQFSKRIKEVIKKNGYTQSTPPFEVISLYEDDTPINYQLSNRGKETFKSLKINGDLAISHLECVPCIVIANKKLGMGTRVPRSCISYDVRAKYFALKNKNGVSKISSNYATFTQDVGRIAGHNKAICTVLISSDVSFINGKDNFKSLHYNLTSQNKPTSNNTEAHGNSKIFSKLKRNTIILDAKPQIGKTGVILSFLSILIEEHTNNSNHIKPSKKTADNEGQNDRDIHNKSNKRQIEWDNTDESKKRQNSTLKIITDSIREASRLKLPRTDIFIKIREIFSNKDDFKQYQIDTNELAKDIHNVIDCDIQDRINDLVEEGINNINILDCGCGLYGTILNIRRIYSSQDYIKINVIGSDANELINDLQKGNNDAVSFTPYIGDFCHTLVAEKSADIIVFSYSLYENDISECVRWSRKYIRDNGILIIVDDKRKFPPNFVEKMKLNGFRSKRIKIDQCEGFYLYYFVTCSIIEQSIIQLNY